MVIIYQLRDIDFRDGHEMKMKSLGGLSLYNLDAGRS